MAQQAVTTICQYQVHNFGSWSSLSQVCGCRWLLLLFFWYPVALWLSHVVPRTIYGLLSVHALLQWIIQANLFMHATGVLSHTASLCNWFHRCRPSDIWHPNAYMTPGISWGGIVSFTLLMEDHFDCIGFIAVHISIKFGQQLTYSITNILKVRNQS